MLSIDKSSGKVRKVALSLSVALSLLVSACSLNNEAGNKISSLNMQESYEITKGACGNLILSDEKKLGDSFEEAVQVLEEEKREYFLSFCPDAPCNEIKLEYRELEVKDSLDNVPPVSFTAIWILDKDNGTLLHSVNDVITSNGYYYNISWCPEEPPLIPGD